MAERALAGRRPHWRRTWTPGHLAIWVVLILVLLLMIYPFFYTVSLAVMPYSEYVRQPIHAWPSGFTLTYFEQILRDARLLRAYQISVLKTLIGTTLNVIATTMAAFALSRRLKLRRPLTMLFIVPLFFSGGLIPYYLVIRGIGLLNTFWALVLPGLVAPFLFFLVRAFFLQYPEEVIEAARVDGAGYFTIFWRIVWPTSTPIIATVALLYGTGHWNDYFWPSILVQAPLHPAIVVLQNITTNRSMLQGLGLGQQFAQASFIAAMAVIIIIPILVVYPFVQRYLIRGIMIGSLKG
jgi:putative aldouronate transport system permease protein